MPESSDVLSLSVKEFVSSTAAKQPTPGGGSVAGVVGALAAGLGEMALNYTRGKKEFAEHEALHARLARRLARAREMFEDLVSDDIQAFGLYQDASGMEDGNRKQEALQLALAAAINVPREMAKLALAVMADLTALAEKCNPHLVSDLTAAAALAVAVVRLCHYNVRINTLRLDDSQAAKDLCQSSQADLARAEKLLGEIEQAAESK